MNILKDIIVAGNTNYPFLLDVYYQENSIAKPIVIFAHGYKGFKDWGCWNLVAEAFAKAGFFFVKFNFSHNGGTITQPIDFPDLEAFGENNYTKELEDLEVIIAEVSKDDFHFRGECTQQNISLIGHSRGGGIVTIKAQESSKITKIISWAGVSDYASRFPKGDALEDWKNTGVYFVINGRTKQEMPHYYQFFEDFQANATRLNIQRAAKNITMPHLIIHGTNDPAVSAEEATLLHNWNPKSTLQLIENADHVFGARHPWEKAQLPNDLAEVVQTTIEFISN